MKRTPLLLAFGEHGGYSRGMHFPPDKDFFRGMVGPFIERHVRSGGKAVIVHEYNIGLSLDGVPRGALPGIISAHEDKIRWELKQTLSRGLEMTRSMDWFDWGFMDDVLQINKERPEAIVSVIEPLGVDTVWLMWQQSSLSRTRTVAESYERALELEIELLKHSVRICIGRDKRLFSYIEKLRQEMPGRAIIVPRGYAHLGMAAYFEHLDYDMTVGYRLRGAPLFSTEAIISSFSRDLSPDELRRLAALSIDYDEFCNSKEDSYLDGAADSKAASNAKRRLALDARAYAFDMEKRRAAG